jgi:uncharacterized protein GlcG (DUF336 family)
MHIGVVGANLTAFARRGGAWLGSIAIAQDKAFTALTFDAATPQLCEKTQPGGSVDALGLSNDGRVITCPATSG